VGQVYGLTRKSYCLPEAIAASSSEGGYYVVDEDTGEPLFSIQMLK